LSFTPKGDGVGAGLPTKSRYLAADVNSAGAITDSIGRHLGDNGKTIDLHIGYGIDGLDEMSSVEYGCGNGTGHGISEGSGDYVDEEGSFSMWGEGAGGEFSGHSKPITAHTIQFHFRRIV
jgi:hypothetical protein